MRRVIFIYSLYLLRFLILLFLIAHFSVANTGANIFRRACLSPQLRCVFYKENRVTYGALRSHFLHREISAQRGRSFIFISGDRCLSKFQRGVYRWYSSNMIYMCTFAPIGIESFFLRVCVCARRKKFSFYKRAAFHFGRLTAVVNG